jgi:phospholipase D1/2
LDSILKEAANRGVIVLVLVYNAPTMALNLDTKHTKKALESLSQNITVVTHPDQGIPKLYSHHEKMVLID